MPWSLLFVGMAIAQPAADLLNSWHIKYRYTIYDPFQTIYNYIETGSLISKNT